MVSVFTDATTFDLEIRGEIYRITAVEMARTIALSRDLNAIAMVMQRVLRERREQAQRELDLNGGPE